MLAVTVTRTARVSTARQLHFLGFEAGFRNGYCLGQARERVEDEARVRLGLCGLFKLNAGIEIVAQAEDGARRCWDPQLLSTDPIRR